MSSFNMGDLTSDDFILMPTALDNVSWRSTIYLSGSFVTNSVVAFTAPSSGWYNLFLVDQNGSAISYDVVPEPSTYAAFAGMFVFGGAVMMRRRRARV